MKNLLLMFTKLAGSHENDVNILIQSCVFIYEKLTKDAFFGMQGGILFIFHRFMPENVRINRIVCIFAPNL